MSMVTGSKAGTATSLPGLKRGRFSNEALVVSFWVEFRDKKLCLDSSLRMVAATLSKVALLLYLELTRQISRLETRIKECIRVESIMVKKPRMRNESE
jgi:hypothetical protein